MLEAELEKMTRIAAENRAQAKAQEARIAMLEAELHKATRIGTRAAGGVGEETRTREQPSPSNAAVGLVAQIVSSPHPSHAPASLAGDETVEVHPPKSPPAPPAEGAAPLEEEAAPANGWQMGAWMRDTLGVHDIIASCFEATGSPFEYAKGLTAERCELLLREGKIVERLVHALKLGLERLRLQQVATAIDLNREFAKGTGKVELAYGGMDTFYGGLEGFIGPPLMEMESASLQAIASALVSEGHSGTGPTLLGKMEFEHCGSPDSDVPFPSQMGEEIVRPRAQWAYAVKEPSPDHYHIGYRCAKSHAHPIYGVRYTHLDKPETLCKGAYDKLLKKVSNGELSEAQLKKELNISLVELREYVPVAGCDAKDPDDDGTFGIGGRCRRGLKAAWAETERRNAILADKRLAVAILEVWHVHPLTRLHRPCVPSNAWHVRTHARTAHVQEVVSVMLYTGPMYLKCASAHVKPLRRGAPTRLNI